MAVYNLAEAQVLMREVLDPRIQKYFEEVPRGWNLIPDGRAEFMNGRGAFFTAQVEPNPDGAYYAETDTLPAGDSVTRKKFNILFTRYAHAGRVTGDAIHTTQRDTLISGISSRVKEDTLTATKLMSEDFYEDGTGVKATITNDAGSVSTSTKTLTFDTPFGSRRVRVRGKYWLVATTTDGGNTIGVALGGSGTEITLTCTSKSQANRTATFDLSSASAITAGTDWILVQKGSYNKAIKGLRYHVNDASGDYQGLTSGRTNYPDQLNAVVNDLNGALTVAAIDETENKALYKQGLDEGMEDLTFLSSPAVVQVYRSFGYHTTSGTTVRKTQEAGSAGKLDLGWPSISHNGHEWKIDIDCPDSELFMLRMKTFGKFFIKPLGLINDDGSTLRMVPAFDSSGNGSFKEQYVYFLNFKGEIGCYAPRLNNRIKRITGTTISGNF